MRPVEELGPFGKAPNGYAAARFTPSGELVVGNSAGLFLLTGPERAAVRIGSGSDELVLSPDGKRCLTDGIEGWDLERRTFLGEVDLGTAVTGLAWLPERNACVAACGEGLVVVDLCNFDPRRLHDAPHGRWLDRGSEHRQVAIDAARRHAITGCAHGVRAWPLDGGAPTLLEGHRGRVIAVDAAPRGTIIASGGDDATVRLWDLARGRQLASLSHHEGGVFRVAFHPRVQRLASGGSEDGQVALWDLPTRTRVRSFEAHPGGVNDLAWSHDGERLATAGQDGRVRVWMP